MIKQYQSYNVEVIHSHTLVTHMQIQYRFQSSRVPSHWVTFKKFILIILNPKFKSIIKSEQCTSFQKKNHEYN